MNIKIQGGGSGTYANTGSCTGVTTYLQHEDLERMKNGQEVQPFFNNSRDYISAQEVTFKIDNNKAKLSRNDAKFYVITVSPSSRELEKMGKTEKEQAEAMRKYVRDDVMQHYAEGFGKGLNKVPEPPHQEQGREESQQQGNSISQVPEINQAPQRKKQQEEELDQPRERSRGFGMGM